MATGVTLRDAVPADAPALARLFLRSRAAALPGLREAHGEGAVAAWIAGELVARHRVRLAEAPGGEPVGYIGHGLAPGGATVFHLYVAPERLRGGVGSALLRGALAERGDRLRLVCLARNAAARAFYERHGFRAAAHSDGATTEEGEPDVLYVRDGAPPIPQDLEDRP